MPQYGTRMIELLSRDVGGDEVMQPGKIYSATYSVGGINSYISGWENEAEGKILSQCDANGWEVVYIGSDFDNKTITVQWKMMDTGNAQAMFAPVVIWVAAIVIVAIIAILLIITIVGAIKEISDIMTENPAMIPIIYGGLAIVGLVAVAYAYKQIKGE